MRTFTCDSVISWAAISAQIASCPGVVEAMALLRLIVIMMWVSASSLRDVEEKFDRYHFNYKDPFGFVQGRSSLRQSKTKVDGLSYDKLQ